MYSVIWKYQFQEEQRKDFLDFASALRFQAKILKKKKVWNMQNTEQIKRIDVKLIKI